MLPVCIAGALSGDCVLYWMGHRWGEGILEWRAIRRMVTREREEQLKSAYRRQGVKILFAARHVMGFRAAAFLTAGIARLPFWRFLAVDGAAATVGISISFGIAYLFTDHVTEIMGDVHRVGRWFGLLALAGVAAWWVISVRRRVRRLPWGGVAQRDQAGARGGVGNGSDLTPGALAVVSAFRSGGRRVAFLTSGSRATGQPGGALGLPRNRRRVCVSSVASQAVVRYDRRGRHYETLGMLRPEAFLRGHRDSCAPGTLGPR
jgi:membrane protein DedA with SNARE-associated domain